MPTPDRSGSATKAELQRRENKDKDDKYRTRVLNIKIFRRKKEEENTTDVSHCFTART